MLGTTTSRPVNWVPTALTAKFSTEYASSIPQEVLFQIAYDCAQTGKGEA